METSVIKNQHFFSATATTLQNFPLPSNFYRNSYSSFIRKLSRSFTKTNLLGLLWNTYSRIKYRWIGEFQSIWTWIFERTNKNLEIVNELHFYNWVDIMSNLKFDISGMPFSRDHPLHKLLGCLEECRFSNDMIFTTSGTNVVFQDFSWVIANNFRIFP